MEQVVNIWEADVGTSLTDMHMMAADSSFTDVCDQAPHRLPKKQDKKSLKLRRRSFSNRPIRNIQELILA